MYYVISVEYDNNYLRNKIARSNSNRVTYMFFQSDVNTISLLRDIFNIRPGIIPKLPYRID